MLFNKKGSATSTLIIMVVLMLSINIGLAFYQEGITEIENTHGVSSDKFFDVGDSPYNNYIEGNLTDGTVSIDSEYILDEEAVSGDTGNIFTDTYNAAKNWFKTQLEPLSFITNLINQPRGFLLDIGIPNSIALAIQVLWSIVFLITLTAFIIGR